MSYARIKPRRGTLYEWSTVNPILDEGELVVIYPDTGVGTGLCKFKIGDGVHKFTELAYAFDGAAAASIDGGSVENFHSINLRTGTTEEWMLVNPIIGKNEITYDSTANGFKVGNGVDTWEDLAYTNSKDEISGISDYGDEDAIKENISSFARIKSEYEKEVEEQETSTMSDLLKDTTEESEENVDIEESEDEEDPMGK